MKYVALLSGGKDSCYNLVHCAQNGHELIAAASLGPEPGKEELDSYMYQTVGQDAIEFVARALEVPLYRRVITGDAVEQGSEYGGRNAKDAVAVAGDETEDLFELLSTVKSFHPDIQGVSVGAILSNYQRVRVENVCRRLNLTSLCYLWQRDQKELLSEMIEAGMEAILIKVAGIGLTTAHLGKTLAQMEPTLTKLNTLYGSHICGEGGEYESLTLDCPLFKHRIILTEVETVIHSDNSFATVAFLRIKSAVLEVKPPNTLSALSPPLLDERYETARDTVFRSQKGANMVQTPPIPLFHHPVVTSRSHRKGNWVAVSGVQVTDLLHGVHMTIEEEVTECFNLLTERLADHGLQLSSCVNINLLIRSMDLFTRVNSVYSTFFGASPPARACVGADLPENIQVRLECIAFVERAPTDRQALHVQGLSYWAPANIGPYSQAIKADESVFMSGQIGLVPNKLLLPSPQSLSMELALASQHVERVTRALEQNSGGGWDGQELLNIYWLNDSSNISHVKTGHRCLQVSEMPTLFLVVKELPKGALVEKQVSLHTGICQVLDEEDGEMSLHKCMPMFEEDELMYGDGRRALRWQVSRFKEDSAACTVVFMKGDFKEKASEIETAVSNLSSTLTSAISARYFYTPAVTPGSLEIVCNAMFGENDFPPTTPVPCRTIGSLQRDDWDLALCIISV